MRAVQFDGTAKPSGCRIPAKNARLRGSQFWS